MSWQAFAPLRDIEGIIGVVLFGAAGRIIARHAEGFPDDALEAASGRVDMLLSSFDESFERVDFLTLGFDGVELFIRRGGELVVLVWASPRTNAEAVKMATKLVLRRVPKPAGETSSDLELLDSGPMPESAPLRAAPPLPRRAPPPPSLASTSQRVAQPFPPRLSTPMAAPASNAASQPFGAPPPRPATSPVTTGTKTTPLKKKKSDIWG